MKRLPVEERDVKVEDGGQKEVQNREVKREWKWVKQYESEKEKERQSEEQKKVQKAAQEEGRNEVKRKVPMEEFLATHGAFAKQLLGDRMGKK